MQQLDIISFVQEFVTHIVLDLELVDASLLLPLLVAGRTTLGLVDDLMHGELEIAIAQRQPLDSTSQRVVHLLQLAQRVARAARRDSTSLASSGSSIAAAAAAITTTAATQVSTPKVQHDVGLMGHLARAQLAVAKLVE